MELAPVCSRLWGVAAPSRWRQVQAAVRDQLVKTAEAAQLLIKMVERLFMIQTMDFSIYIIVKVVFQVLYG